MTLRQPFRRSMRVVPRIRRRLFRHSLNWILQLRWRLVWRSLGWMLPLRRRLVGCLLGQSSASRWRLVRHSMGSRPFGRWRLVRRSMGLHLRRSVRRSVLEMQLLQRLVCRSMRATLSVGSMEHYAMSCCSWILATLVVVSHVSTQLLLQALSLDSAPRCRP